MPVQKVNGGYRWGDTGTVYPTSAQAERQGAAIEAGKRPSSIYWPAKKPHIKKKPG